MIRPITAIMLVGLLAVAARVDAQLTYRAYEQITVANTAVGFTAATIRPAGLPRASVAMCTLETGTGDIRFTIDGTTPTSSTGSYWVAGSSFWLAGEDVLNAFRSIRVTASSGTLDCTYTAGTNIAVAQAVNGQGGGGGGSSSTVSGNKTNNNAAPGATNIGALTGIANAVAPTYTEGDQVLLSTDLAGGLRIAGSAVDANTYALVVNGATATANAAATVCNILTTVSTNSINCKASAGNVYGYEIYNTTTTVYYLRLYNSAGAPTCSSATGFIRSIPIPPAAAAGQVGGAVSNQGVPVNYTTGVGYCITASSTSTANDNAAAGIFGEIRVK